MSLLVIVGLALLAGAITSMALGLRARGGKQLQLASARAEAALWRKRAEIDAATARRSAERHGRERAIEIRAAAERDAAAAAERAAAVEESLDLREQKVRATRFELERKSADLDQRYQEMRSRREDARNVKRAATELGERGRRALEERSGENAEQVVQRLTRRWLEEARSGAAHLVRSVEQAQGDPEWARRARRVMEISVARYKNHFLTERGVSNVAVIPQVIELLSAGENRFLNTLQEVSNVQLHIGESGESVRLEGLDGVGREIARRALARLNKKPSSQDEALCDPVNWARKIRVQLEQEIQGLGKKAFTVLKLPRAHQEIVTLVGRLNYRTSFTQNQWLHAVEASFLAGMMAEEMGLDVRLARRATLLHDIGKALTHEMDGSHAVIGADIARRLGESEVVANAIGAHHADEPPGSVYAFLVAGADAMSGARPGARREHADGYNTRLEDLERIGHSYRGVERCFAVHGGRELRVYVREDQVSDLDAVEMSSEIAERISEELTFPGQIKVTIIRATEAVAIAN